MQVSLSFLGFVSLPPFLAGLLHQVYLSLKMMKTIVCGLRNRSIWVHLGVLKSKCAFSFPWFGFEVCNGLLLTSLTPGCYLKPGIGQSLPSRSLTIPHEDCADFYVNVFIFMILYHHFFYRRGLICMFFFLFLYGLYFYFSYAFFPLLCITSIVSVLGHRHL